MHASHGMHEHALPHHTVHGATACPVRALGARVEISCMDLLPCACIGEQLDNINLYPGVATMIDIGIFFV
jgi:hypothetical protein